MLIYISVRHQIKESRSTVTGNDSLEFLERNLSLGIREPGFVNIYVVLPLSYSPSTYINLKSLC